MCKRPFGWVAVSRAVNRYRLVETNSQGPAPLAQILGGIYSLAWKIVYIFFKHVIYLWNFDKSSSIFISNKCSLGRNLPNEIFPIVISDVGFNYLNKDERILRIPC